MKALTTDEVAALRDYRRHRYLGKPTATAAVMRDKMNAYHGLSLTLEDVLALCHKHNIPAPEPARHEILKSERN